MEHTGLFTVEKIASCSVYGNKSATSPDGYVRPALGPEFLALKGKHTFLEEPNHKNMNARALYEIVLTHAH